MIRVLALFSMLCIVGGCVIVPLPSDEEEPFTEEEFQFTKPGATSKDEVRESLGRPADTFLDGEYWVYHADRIVSRWLYIFAVPAGFGAMGDGGIAEEKRQYTLIIGFDDHDNAHEVKVVHEEKPCGSDGQTCFSAGFLELPPGLPNQFEVEREHCTVILHSSNAIDLRSKRWVMIKGVGIKVGKLLRELYDEIYVSVDLPVGQHEVKTLSFLDDEMPGSIEIDCVAGEARFVQVKYPKGERASLSFLSADEGRKDLLRRRRAIPKD